MAYHFLATSWLATLRSYKQQSSFIWLSDVTRSRGDASDSQKSQALIERLSPSISGFVHFLKGSWPCLLTSTHHALLVWHQMPHARTHTHKDAHIHMHAGVLWNTNTPTLKPPSPKKTHWVNFSPPSVRTHTAANAEIKARHWRIY